MNDKNKIPVIRFKGFSGEWEVREFSTVVARISSMSGKIELPRVEYEDIISGKGELNKNIYQKKSTKIGIEFDKEDILYGKLRPYLKNWLLPNFNGIAVGDFWVLRGNETNSKFIYNLIQTFAYEKAANQSSGTKMPRSDWNLVSKTLFNIPIKNNEQAKIGNYFQQLDKLINLHHRKYNKLLKVKKAMLEKMFPKNGENIPEIRFKGFSEKWEERELGEVAKITMGQSPNGVNYTNNPEDNILVQGNADMKNGLVVPRIWTKQITKTADIEDLIFSVRAPVGEIGKTTYNVVIGRGVAAIKGNEFVFQSLKRMNENGCWKKLSAGSTFDSINSIDLSTAVIVIPNKKEQTKIGNFFKNLDNLLTLHQSKLEKLKNIKKACLEKMFA